jgi:FkbM family methyltransferase
MIFFLYIKFKIIQYKTNVKIWIKVNMEKIWQLYDDKQNEFFTKSFSDNKDLTSYWGFDFVYREIYNFEHSQTGCIYEMWDCVLKPEDVVLDLGANCGFFTYKACSTSKKVIAVDGSPESYSCLVQNCKDFSNILTLNASILSKGSEQSWLWSKRGNPLRFTLEELMDIYKLEKIDFIKCDIEGGEYELFKSLSEETLSKIDRIAIETHDENLNEDFYLPGKIRHTFYWNFGGGVQTMVYFVTPK